MADFCFSFDGTFVNFRDDPPSDSPDNIEGDRIWSPGESSELSLLFL